MKGKVVRWIIVLFLALLAALGIHYFLRTLGVPLYRDFYGQLITVELAFLALFGALFVGSNRKKLAPQEAIINFFGLKFTLVVCIALALTLILWLVSGEKPEQPHSVPPASSGSSPKTDPGQGENSPQQAEPPMPVPYCSLPEWEEDAFLLNLDKYCGYHVDDDDISPQVLGLLSQCLSDITFRGPYPPDELNGAGSLYASHTARANELRRGYDLLYGDDILLDYRIMMLEDELEERGLADQLYSVAINKKIMGDICLKLGDIYCNEIEMEDLNKASEYYKRAFEIFLAAYRTCYEEGADEKTFRQILECLDLTSEKLSMLEGMDSREQKMAPIIVGALKQLYG